MKRKIFRRIKEIYSITQKKWQGKIWMPKLFVAGQNEAKTWFLFDAVDQE